MVLGGGGGSSGAGGSLFDWSRDIAKQGQRKRYRPAQPQGRSSSATAQYTSRNSAARYSGGGGGGGYSGGSNYSYSGGGGGGLGRLGRKGRSGAPSLSYWLRKDADYQDQLRAFNRSLSDFLADTGRRKTTLSTDYDTGVKRMGEQRVKDLQDIMNDFAARGLLKSGLFGQRQADYEKQYQQNLTDLSTQNKKSLTDLSNEEKNFRRQQELQKESARKEAARRRAEKYGL